VVFSFCNDHQFIDVNRCENYSWSTGKWWFRCLVLRYVLASWRALSSFKYLGYL